VYGFAQSLIKFVTDHTPRYLAVVFDSDPIESFRTDIFPGYKSGRTEPPDDLEPQFDRCGDVAEALGMATFAVDGFEADDILAVLAHRLSGAGRMIEILTQDKDMFQLVRPGVVVRTFSGERLDASAVRARLGVSPARVTDYQALVGDPVDSIPGVPGVGPKTARMLLEQFSSLDGLLAHLHRVPNARLRERLAAYADQARLSFRLAHLRDDAPLRVRLADLRYRGASARTRRLFPRLGLGRLVERVPQWAGDRAGKRRRPASKTIGRSK
jgi:DNA polymerase-1